MSQRKPHNRRARLERACRALLSTNHVAVVSLEPSDQQFLINWKNAKKIISRQVVDAVCDIPHRWCIYFGVFCIDQFNSRYIKSVEIAPQGLYLSTHLDGVIEEYYRALIAECNQNHVIGSGWIANPCSVSLDEAQAARIFDAVNAWPSQEVA